MQAVEARSQWAALRLFPKAMSNQAAYNYVMLLKYWFMQDAVERTQFGGNVAWMDFGFNHGGACYSHPDDFAFLWKPDFSNGIHLFAKANPDRKMSIGALLLQSDVFMGCPVVARAEKCKKLWEYCKAAMEALLSLDAMDDDQQLLLMAYKLHPEEFAVHYSDWFLPIKENGGGHLRVREGYGSTQKDPLAKRAKALLGRILFALGRDYSRGTAYNFGMRMKNFAKKELASKDSAFGKN